MNVDCTFSCLTYTQICAVTVCLHKHLGSKSLPHLTVCAGISASLCVLRSVVPEKTHHQLSWGITLRHTHTHTEVNNLGHMFLRSSINTHAPLYRIIISPLLLIFFYLFWGPPTALISWQHMGGISSWGLIVAAQSLSHVSLHRPSRLLRNIAAGTSHPLPETHTSAQTQ